MPRLGRGHEPSSGEGADGQTCPVEMTEAVEKRQSFLGYCCGFLGVSLPRDLQGSKSLPRVGFCGVRGTETFCRLGRGLSVGQWRPWEVTMPPASCIGEGLSKDPSLRD